MCHRETVDSGKKLSCGHIFHFHCLRSWLERQHTCPTCRADIDPAGQVGAAPAAQRALEAVAGARPGQAQPLGPPGEPLAADAATGLPVGGVAPMAPVLEPALQNNLQQPPLPGLAGLAGPSLQATGPPQGPVLPAMGAGGPPGGDAPTFGGLGTLPGLAAHAPACLGGIPAGNAGGLAGFGQPAGAPFSNTQLATWLGPGGVTLFAPPCLLPAALQLPHPMQQPALLVGAQASTPAFLRAQVDWLQQQISIISPPDAPAVCPAPQAAPELVGALHASVESPSCASAQQPSSPAPAASMASGLHWPDSPDVEDREARRRRLERLALGVAHAQQE